MPNYYGSVITEMLHPFGRTGTSGALSSTGANYGAVVSSSAVADTFGTVESVTVNMPTNCIIREVEYGLTMGGYLATSTAAFDIRYRITDAGGTSYDTLLISTALLSVVSTGRFCDVTYAGRNTPSDGTYFTGRGGFTVLGSIACGSTTKAFGAMKQSSYIMYKYNLIG